MFSNLFSNKPEVIDPEEKNFTYYYNRNKKKKGLADFDDCCSKNIFFGNTRGKSFSFVFLILVLGAFFIYSHIRFSSKNISYFENESYKIVLTGYSINEFHKIIGEILIINKEERAYIIPLTKLVIFFVGKDNEIIEQKEISVKNIYVSSKEFKQWDFEINSDKKLKKIKASIMIDDKEIVIEKNN